MRSIFLSQHTNRWGKEDIWYVEDTQHDIILISLEPQIFVHAIRLCIT